MNNKILSSSPWQYFESNGINWIVDELVAENSLGWFYGKPGSYKSFVIMDMAFCVAAGIPWMGKDVRKGPVLWIAAEGGMDVHIRHAALESNYQYPDAQFYIEKIQPQLDEIDSYGISPAENLLKDKIKKIIRDVHNRTLENVSNEMHREHDIGYDSTLSLVVIDTFGQTASDDNKQSVSKYISVIRNILGEVYCKYTSFIVIDHTTKNGDSFMGAQAKMGNVDLMMQISKKNNCAIISMKNSKGKIKSLPEIDDIVVSTRKHKILKPDGSGLVDSQGRAISTLVCGSNVNDDIKELNATKASDAIIELVKENQESSISKKELRKKFMEYNYNGDKKYNTILQYYYRTLKYLIKEGLLILNSDGSFSFPKA